MSKILTTLIAGLFAASAFAADVPKTTAATDAKPAAEAPAANKTVKKEHKTTHQATHHKAAKTGHTDSGMGTAPSTTAAPVSK